MIPPKAKEILDFIVSICSIVSCVAAVYGVFQVVEFVVDVRPIVIPFVQEVKEGNVDVRKMFSNVAASVRHDTVRIVERDTIYLPQDESQSTKNEYAQMRLSSTREHTKEEEQRLDNSADNISVQEREEIDEEETSFRNRMRDKTRQHRVNQSK